MKLKEILDFIHEQDIVEVLAKCDAIQEENLSGRKYLCPFHDEKTPSLNFYEDGYYCFGCSAGGDAVSFLQDIFDLSFIQAVKLISEAYGLELDDVQYGNPFLEKSVNTDSLEKEWEIYLKNMEDAPEEVKEKAVEYFPLKLGYDKGINYLVFRYTSKTGKTLSFTKRRAFDTDDKSEFPKWKHSSRKNSNIEMCRSVFNLGEAVRHIRKEKKVILVEGPKDVIPFLRENMKYVVAISGASHFSKSYEVLPEVNEYIFSLDGDEAGHEGTLKGTCFLADKISLENVFYIDLGDKDPYDYYMENDEIPEKKPVLSCFDKEELKKIYSHSSSYNKNLIKVNLLMRENISWDEAESYFSDVKDEKKLDKDELSSLCESNDPNAALKLKLKFGIGN